MYINPSSIAKYKESQAYFRPCFYSPLKRTASQLRQARAVIKTGVKELIIIGTILEQDMQEWRGFVDTCEQIGHCAGGLAAGGRSDHY